MTIDAAQTITFFNSGAEEIFGWKAEEVVGRPLDVLLPERFRARHHEHVRAFGRADVQARRMGERRAISGVRKNGEEFPAEASIAKIEEDGDTTYSVVLRDVTARVRAEETQRWLARLGSSLAVSLDYRETLDRVAELAAEGVAPATLIFVEEGPSVTCVAAAHRDPGSAEGWAGAHVGVHAPADHPVRVILDAGETTLLTGAALGPFAPAPGGRAVTAVALAPLFARGRTFGALAFVAVDGEPRFDAERMGLAKEVARRAALALDNARLYGEARQAILARDEVLSVVSHDLGNPLSAIFVATKVLRRQTEAEDLSPLRRSVDLVRQSAEQLQGLIEDLVEVQRIEAGRLSVVRREVEVDALLDRVLERMEPLAAERDLDLVVERRGAIGSVRADEARLLQVFQNLVGNAIKFTPRGGRIRVVAEPRAGTVVFSVRDSGPGIGAADLAHVFDRFWQARHTGSHGAGLGLSIARGIVEAHGGEMGVESTPGEGSTFSFTVEPTPDGDALIPSAGRAPGS